MSNHHNNGLFVDTGLLRDHVSKLREERKLACKLYDTVAAMRKMSDPSLVPQYNRILRDVEQLIEYFGRMADLLSKTSDEAVQLSRQIGTLIQDETEYAHHVTNQNIML